MPAASTRLEGSVKVGPAAHHQPAIIGFAIAAVILLIGGVAGAYFFADPGGVTAVSTESSIDAVPGDDPLAFDSTGADLETTARNGVVRLELDGCGLESAAPGIVLDSQTILARRSDVETDIRPVTVDAAGNRLTGQIVGWSHTSDIAVIRTDQTLAAGLQWGVASRLSEGSEVHVIEMGDGTNVTIIPTPITAFGTRDGMAVSIQIDTTAPKGSPVLDADGLLVALVSGPGRADLNDEIRPVVSQILLAEDPPEADCSSAIEGDTGTLEPGEEAETTE